MLSCTMTATDFADFVADAEPRLRRALVAAFGPGVGRDATIDALSWGWEHWARLRKMKNPVGYLFRVGQSHGRRTLRIDERQGRLVGADDLATGPVEPDVELVAALRKLSDQQRVAVVLVHGHGLPLREVAEVMSVSVATVRQHVSRGLARLRLSMEVADVH
jgi:DNA-directed RNA polymerase specialized sigma24 family protein